MRLRVLNFLFFIWDNPCREVGMSLRQIGVLTALFVLTLASAGPASAQPEGKEGYPGPIDIDKMDAAHRAVSSYSFYVPPYNLYYFHHIDKLNIRQDWIRRSGPVFALREPSAPFSASYTYASQRHALDEYLSRNYVVGFIVLRDNQILLEKYFHGADRIQCPSRSLPCWLGPPLPRARSGASTIRS
jgi:hypothetical protein